MAQLIVRGSYANIRKETFTEISGIYKFTNEDITAYFHHLQNRKNILSVIVSGNQILNSILAGTQNIDCFDISIYPQYYLFLQIASIISLSKTDYLKYFLSNDKEELFSDSFYEEISNNLKGNYKTFWDTLYMFDDGIDIYNSSLFIQNIYNKDAIIERNPFLQDNNYDKLKHILKTQNIQINPMVADIMTHRFDKKYDLIVLSNILGYMLSNKETDSKEKYIEHLKDNYSLAEQGEIINYFFNMDPKTIEEFKQLLNSNSYIENINQSKLLVYKK